MYNTGTSEGLPGGFSDLQSRPIGQDFVDTIRSGETSQAHCDNEREWNKHPRVNFTEAIKTHYLQTIGDPWNSVDPVKATNSIAVASLYSDNQPNHLGSENVYQDLPKPRRHLLNRNPIA